MKRFLLWSGAAIALAILFVSSGCGMPGGDVERAGTGRGTSPAGVYVGVIPEERKEEVMRALEDMHARVTTQEEKDEIRRQIDEGIAPLPETILVLTEQREYSMTSEDQVLIEGTWTVEGDQITLFAVSMLDRETGEMVPAGAGPDSEAKVTWNRTNSTLILHAPDGDMVFELDPSR